MVIRIGKKFWIGLSIFLIIAGLYNVIYFAIPWKRDVSNAAFWLTYIFTWIALLFAGIVAIVAFNKKELKSRVFGIPIFFIGVALLAIQFSFDLLIMCLSFAIAIPIWIVAVFEALVFGLSLISVILRTAYRSTIDAIDAKTQKETQFIKELRIEADALVQTNSIEQIKVELEKMLETIKCANPVSNSDVKDLEEEINYFFEQLKSAVHDGDLSSSEEFINKLNPLLKERENRLKLSHK